MKAWLYMVVYRLHTVLGQTSILWAFSHDLLIISAYAIVMQWGMIVAVVTNVDMTAFVRLFLCNNTLKCYIQNLFFMYKQKL